MRSVKSVLLLALFAMGCGGADAFEGPASIDGTWSEVFSIPGSGMDMVLTSNGSTVSGTGDFAGEAGPAGNVAVTGTIEGIAVHLDLTFTQELPQTGPTTLKHFDGQFTSPNTLKGSLTTDGQPLGQTDFRRVAS